MPGTVSTRCEVQYEMLVRCKVQYEMLVPCKVQYEVQYRNRVQYVRVVHNCMVQQYHEMRSELVKSLLCGA